MFLFVGQIFAGLEAHLENLAIFQNFVGCKITQLPLFLVQCFFVFGFLSQMALFCFLSFMIYIYIYVYIYIYIYIYFFFF